MAKVKSMRKGLKLGKGIRKYASNKYVLIDTNLKSGTRPLYLNSRQEPNLPNYNQEPSELNESFNNQSIPSEIDKSLLLDFDNSSINAPSVGSSINSRSRRRIIPKKFDPPYVVDRGTSKLIQNIQKHGAKPELSSQSRQAIIAPSISSSFSSIPVTNQVLPASNKIIQNVTTQIIKREEEDQGLETIEFNTIPKIPDLPKNNVADKVASLSMSNQSLTITKPMVSVNNVPSVLNELKPLSQPPPSTNVNIPPPKQPSVVSNGPNLNISKSRGAFKQRHRIIGRMYPSNNNPRHIPALQNNVNANQISAIPQNIPVNQNPALKTRINLESEIEDNKRFIYDTLKLGVGAAGLGALGYFYPGIGSGLVHRGLNFIQTAVMSDINEETPR
jgi:hypothetical protein